MKIERKDKNILLEVSHHEIELLIVGLLAYESNCGERMGRLKNAGAGRENSLMYVTTERDMNNAIDLGLEMLPFSTDRITKA